MNVAMADARRTPSRTLCQPLSIGGIQVGFLTVDVNYLPKALESLYALRIERLVQRDRLASVARLGRRLSTASETVRSAVLAKAAEGAMRDLPDILTSSAAAAFEQLLLRALSDVRQTETWITGNTLLDIKKAIVRAERTNRQTPSLSGGKPRYEWQDGQLVQFAKHAFIAHRVLKSYRRYFGEGEPIQFAGMTEEPATGYQLLAYEMGVFLRKWPRTYLDPLEGVPIAKVRREPKKVALEVARRIEPMLVLSTRHLDRLYEQTLSGFSKAERSALERDANAFFSRHQPN